MVSTPSRCFLCKGGKFLCGQRPCPLIARLNLAPKVKLSTDFFGPSYSIFVGHTDYPNVRVGPLAAVQDKGSALHEPERRMMENLDNPAAWFGMDYKDVVELRSLLLRSSTPQNIFTRSSFISDNQALAMAKRPADVEMKFDRAPKFEVSFSDVHQPMGPSAALTKLRIVDNVKIDHRVEYIASDELRAAEAVSQFYKSDLDVYKISTILSSGVLGRAQHKKLVPTRWSITSIDDIIGKKLIEDIRTLPVVDEFLVFESTYLDNHFVILLMPGAWELENFEAWAPGSVWAGGAKQYSISEEYEGFSGRTTYAKEQAGGYYAARLGIAEGLAELRRQAAVVSFREVSEGYVIPLGVWVVRETVRNAFGSRPVEFPTKADALRYITSRLKIPIEEYISKSAVLRQKRLSDFF